MVIRFACPNGHKIHCPDAQAGRAARCPQCGSRFRVPGSDQPDVRVEAFPAAGASDSNIPAAAAPAASQSTPHLPSPPRESEIEFLCPNGHRLHGPASLQGKPGECPDCGCRFRIPSYDEVSEEEELEQDLGRGHIDGSMSDVGQEGPAEEPFPQPEEQPLDQSPEETPPHEMAVQGEELNGGEADGQPPGDQSPGGQVPAGGWATLFAQLWAHRSPGVVIELGLEDGQSLAPERFAAYLSKNGLAVFGVKNANGTHEVTAVPWSSVRRVDVKGLKQLPDDLFE